MEWSRVVEWSLEWSGVGIWSGVSIKTKQYTILYVTCAMKRKLYCNHFCIVDVNNLVQ